MRGLTYWQAVSSACIRARAGSEPVYVYWSAHTQGFHVVYERVAMGWPMNTSNRVMLRVGHDW